MTDEPITALEVHETEYEEKVVLDFPFDAKDFIKIMPWGEYSEEVANNGSLRAKAVSRGMSEDNVAIKAAEDYHEQHGFSDDFATHTDWDKDGFGIPGVEWAVDIDADSFEEARRFLEFCGFEVEVADDVNL